MDSHARHYTEVKCECGTVLARRDAEGVVWMGSSPVVFTLAKCPECHAEVPISQFAIDGNCLEFSTAAIEQIVLTLRLINGNEGFGELKIKFQKGRARWVGLGETMRDCQ